MPMFGFYKETRSRDPEARRRRRAAALISLGGHLVFGGMIFRVVSPLKVRVRERMVGDVVIVEPPPVYIPRSAESGSRRDPGPDAPARDTDPAKRASAPPDPPVTGRPGPREGSGDDPGPSARPGAAFPNLAAGRFRLAVPRIDPASLPVEEGFILSPYAGNPWFPGRDSAKDIPVIDLSRYSGWRPGESPASAGGEGTAVPGRRGGVAVQGEAVDLGPWADAVVTAIQENWFISPGRRPAVRGEVEVLVTVGRGGEVLEVLVARDSGSEAVDESALKALRIAPFPALPDPFPGERLEIRLVFEVK